VNEITRDRRQPGSRLQCKREIDAGLARKEANKIASAEWDSGCQSKSKEAGAEQYEASGGEGEEALGNEVMMTHVTSSFSEARRN
jgi:hypothetical protein